MQQQTDMGVPLFKHPVPDRRSAVYLTLALSGLSFLFFLGFPFANHNESYWWIVILDKIPFIDALTTRLEPVQSFRPLGTATAWLTYRLTGNIYLQQLLNWLLACLSFAVLFRYAKNKVVFSLATFITTVCFFSGYIYLFHLHGVFYGPLQLFIALITGVAYTHKTLTWKHLAFLFSLTVIAGLYHTFALLVFAAYMGGCMLQVPKAEWRSQLPKLFLFLIGAMALMYLILRMHPNQPGGDVVEGTLASFTTTEINLPVSLVTCLLALLTVSTMPLAPKPRFALAIIVVLVSLLMIYVHIPVLLLWFFLCLLKMVFFRNWALAAIVFATALFPIATHTGTPTYLVFVIMVCVFVTSINALLFSYDYGFLKKSILGFLAALVMVLVLLKEGIRLPGIASGLSPVLSEREKTRQLETILAWKKSTPDYTNYRLRFLDESGKPSASKNAVNRKNRPPTQQGYLNRYLNATMTTLGADTTNTPPLLITFGNKPIQGRQKVFEVRGTWNGNAYVYK